MRKAKLTGYALLFICIAGITVHSAMKKTRSIQRDIPTLLNFYYNYKEKNPLKAKEALDLILKQDPANNIAIQAKGLWFIQQGDTHSALLFFKNTHALYPKNSHIAFELAKLYIMLNKMSDAKPLLKNLLTSNDSELKKKSMVLYQVVYPHKTSPEKIANYRSFIAPIPITTPQDLSVLRAKVQEIIKLQPNSARNYLQLILSMNPNDSEAYRTLGYLELQEHHEDKALEAFLNAFSIKQDAQLAVQIAYLYDQKKDTKQAMSFFNFGAKYGNDTLKQQSLKALAMLNIAPTDTPIKATSPPKKLSSQEILWSIFYMYKQTQPAVALNAINHLLQKHPNDIRTLKEAAYFAMAQKNDLAAIALWKQAYALEKNPEYALSIAYLYDATHNNRKAFHFFDLASKTNDDIIKKKAELAMTSLAGSQFQFLPKPFFVETYASPFYFSRFDLGVFPSIARAGITLNDYHHTDAYASWRRTKDNRSGTAQGLAIQTSISQIFEDNVAIYALGLRTYPWPKIPLQTFLEVGQAYDLVDRNRAKWRSDVRGGLVYYNTWGEKPSWTKQLAFPMKWVSTLYADTIYYSRYDDNVIGTAWFRPGLRVATFQSASLDVYMANYLIIDKNREFFNNLYSLGPGIALQPSNRINLVLRLESLQGFYIPVNSPTPNPYRSKYYNNLAMLEVYFRF